MGVEGRSIGDGGLCARGWKGLLMWTSHEDAMSKQSKAKWRLGKNI